VQKLKLESKQVHPVRILRAWPQYW